MWNFGEDPIRRDLYVAEVLITPHFDRKCLPSDGVLLNRDVLRLCGTHDIGEYVDLIFKITGSYPKERLIDDVNAGNINAAARSELMKLGRWTFVFAWPHSVTGQHLFYDYYLIRYHMCGNADPYC